MAPSLVVIAAGFDPTRTLVISQVVLSIALPLPMVALVLFTSRRDIMGEFVNPRPTIVAAVTATIVVLSLNLVLILQSFGVPIPGLAG